MYDPTAQIEALESGELASQVAAAQWLAQHPEAAAAAAPALIRLAGHEDESLREWVAGALEELGPPRAVDVPALADLLVAAPPLADDVAWWAATLLGRLGPPAAAAAPALAQCLSTHAAINVRQQVARALGQIGADLPEALTALADAARSTDPRLARLAAEALGRLGA